MFDAKSILESIVRGAAPSQTPQQSGGTLADVLNDILKNTGGQSAPPGSGGSLSDALGELARKLGQPSLSPASASPPPGAVPGGGTVQEANPNWADVLAQIKQSLGQASGSVTDGGNFTDVLGKIFTQATQGVKEGAGRIGEATGAGDALGRVAANADADELLTKLRALIESNPFSAGAAAGGLGGLVLGTRAGRSLAANAAKIGALAMIGGLAYKAVQNYQAGKPLITGATPPQAAPTGSGFEPTAVTSDAATLYIQAMIAAAAADGRVDAGEQDKIITGLKQAGLDGEAEAFLAQELNSPRSVQELASAITSPQEAIQVYTAARIAVNVDSPAEQQFLQSLARALDIDPKLAAHIDATAASAAA